jgi:hypothetical protein
VPIRDQGHEVQDLQVDVDAVDLFADLVQGVDTAGDDAGASVEHAMVLELVERASQED